MGPPLASQRIMERPLERVHEQPRPQLRLELGHRVKYRVHREAPGRKGLNSLYSRRSELPT